MDFELEGETRECRPTFPGVSLFSRDDPQKGRSARGQRAIREEEEKVTYCCKAELLFRYGISCVCDCRLTELKGFIVLRYYQAIYISTLILYIFKRI